MAYKQNFKSPIMKALVGKQKNLPQELQDAIKAAPETPAKMYDSPAKMYGSPLKAQMGPGPSAKPKYDKELNDLVAQRKGLKRGTSEYNKVQNRINEKLGSNVRRRTDVAPAVQVKSKSVVGSSASAQKPQMKKVSAPSKPTKTNRIETPITNTDVTKIGGGARKGGTTVKQKENIVTGNKKTVVKNKNTRTVTKTKKDGTTTTKTTKRLGKGRIKEAVANIAANRKKRRAENAKFIPKNYGL